MPAIQTIQMRNGTAAAWTAANPVLAAGELGFESDTRLAKMGNGTGAWATLAYLWADRDLAITDVFTTANQAAMTALTAQPGDVAIRTDEGNAAYMLQNAPASTAGNWVRLSNTPVMTGSTAGAAGTSGIVPVPAAGTQASFLRGDGTWAAVPAAAAMTGANGTVAGTAGTVPQPAATENNSFLRGDATWTSTINGGTP
jgi:hypothetical protein